MRKYIYISFLLVLLLASCHRHSDYSIRNEAILQAQDLLWRNVDSAQQVLFTVEEWRLPIQEDHIYHLLRAHAMLKTTQRLPSDIDLGSTAEYFTTEKMWRYAGEAYYVLGAERNWRGVNADAMTYLKQAEQSFLRSSDAPDILLGMTYYKMGRISETEQLYEVAAHYYRKAEPYLSSADIPLYAASEYRELGRTAPDTAQQRVFFEKALSYVGRIDTITYLDIRYAALSRLQPDSPELMQISRYLCDSAGIRRYAYDLVKESLNQNNLSAAEHYLKVLSGDTAALSWSSEKYSFLHSRLLAMQGNSSPAYKELFELYNKLSNEIEASGMTRTYTISQRYDNATEREKNLQLQLEKQRLFVSLAIVLIIALLLAIVALFWGSHRKAQRLLEKAADDAKIATLRAEVNLRRESMQHMLQERINLSKSFQESALRHKDEGTVPEWAQEFVENSLFRTEQQWASFRDEFNSLHGNLLSSLKEEHPAITPSDQQVIALIILGLDISDVCLLLNLTKRTIWSRRLRIKEHLGLSEEDKLDSWLFVRTQELINRLGELPLQATELPLAVPMPEVVLSDEEVAPDVQVSAAFDEGVSAETNITDELPAATVGEEKAPEKPISRRGRKPKKQE